MWFQREEEEEVEKGKGAREGSLAPRRARHALNEGRGASR